MHNSTSVLRPEIHELFMKWLNTLCYDGPLWRSVDTLPYVTLFNCL